MQKNLEQIRALHALDEVFNGRFDRNDVNGLPALVQSSGLLATAAFVSVGQGARDGMWNAMNAVARHLRCAETGPLLTMTAHGSEQNPTKVMLRELSERDSQVLIRATAEALAFISYLKRFAPSTP